MDKEIEKRKEDNSLHCGLRIWLKECTRRFEENGYNNLES